ncbi:hypothetical protein E2C01_047654 [Portunus trituberculatus]|uniref:Uncharacterized protein n=1 Tax=Portunus trituberculatus TaxID=210409 RepID=A0A5B7G8H6_PORTR|nr:hypothetical protein [Portunus trituberculatus]
MRPQAETRATPPPPPPPPARQDAAAGAVEAVAAQQSVNWQGLKGRVNSNCRFIRSVWGSFTSCGTQQALTDWLPPLDE